MDEFWKNDPVATDNWWAKDRVVPSSISTAEPPPEEYLSTDEAPLDPQQRRRRDLLAYKKAYEIINEGADTAKALGIAEKIVKPFANPLKAVLELPEQLWRSLGYDIPYTAEAPLISPDTAKTVVEKLTPGGAASEGSAGQAVQEFVAETASGLTSPDMAAAALAAKKFPVPVARYFQGQMASQLPASLEAFKEAETGKEKTKAALSAVASVALPALIEKGLKEPTAEKIIVERAKEVGPATEAAVGKPNDVAAHQAALDKLVNVSVKAVDNATKAQESTGWTFDGEQLGAMTPDAAAQLTPEQRSQLSPAWAFTDRRKGSPTEGYTTYVKAGETQEGAIAAIERKTAEIVAAKPVAPSEVKVGVQPSPVGEKPAVEPTAGQIGPPSEIDAAGGATVKQPSGAAETITGSNERIGSEMPAEREKRPKRRIPENRPHDLIDEFEGQAGGKISLSKARSLVEDFKPTGALRKLFASDGLAPDVAAQASGFKGSDVEFLEALQKAAEARKALRTGQSKEAEQLRVEEKQLEQFQDKALRGNRPKSESENVERVPVHELNVGDKFKVQDHEFEVTNLEFDGDTLVSLTVKDGPKFGVQTFSPDITEFIHVDKTTFKPAPVAKGGELFGQETPFNLAGETVKGDKPAETKTGYGEQTLAQQEMFAIQKIVESKDPRKSADAAEKLYGSAREAIPRIRKQLEVVDADPETRRAFVKEQRQRLKEVLALLEQRAAKNAEPAVEARGTPKPARNVFDIPEAELDSFFKERTPSTESLGRAKYRFANYNEFRDWMNARYAERDLEGMKEAFAEVGTPLKVQYIKENRGGAAHLKDWISHIATGSPLPSVDPPKPRTTPRPMPGAWTAPPPGAPPGTGAAPPGTQPPPPPPPKPPPPSAMPSAPMGTPPTEPVRASEIIKDLADLMDRPIRFGHMAQGQSTLGIFKTKIEVARIRRANDIPTAAHETAHMLERIHRKALGVATRQGWYGKLPADVLKELQGLDYDPSKQRAFEGFAEFVRHWITEGDTATVAPNTHAWFESTFLKDNANLAEGLNAIREKGMAFRNQGAVKRVESMLQFDEPKQPFWERVKQAGHTLNRLFFDDLSTSERAEKEIKGGELAVGAESPTKTARMVTQGAGARARTWAVYGMTDFAGNRVGPALREIFGREGIKGDERNAIVYAVAKRAVELHERGIDPGITVEDARHTVRSLETPEREAFSKEVRDWNEGALKYLLDAGGISQETFDKAVSLNKAYIPFFRVWEREMGGGFGAGGRRLGDTPQPIKRIKGSGREIIDPTQSMQQHAQQIIAVADKVRTAKAWVDLVGSEEGFGKYVEEIPADKAGISFELDRIRKQLESAGADLSGADLDAVMTLFQPSPRTPMGNIVSFVRDGNRHFYELDPELYRALQALDYRPLHPLLDLLLGKASRMVRLGATGIRAGFTLLTNPIRDFATLMVQSKFNPATASVQWAKHMAKQIGFRDSEVKNVWRAMGGELTQPLGLDREGLKRAVDDVLNNTAKQKALNVIRHPIEFARLAMSFTEAAPRLAEFEMTLREMGWKPGQKVSPDMAIEAAMRAAEVTVNFKRAGAWGRQINQAVAFFNPALQGLSKFTRSHTDQKIGAVAKGIGFITIPALVNWWMNKDDERWQELPDWVKFGFLNFKVNGEWMRFPTPFEWWYTYGAIPMAAVNQFYKKRPEETKKVMWQALKQSAPPILPSVITPVWEASANKSFYTGKPIVPAGLGQLLPQEQAQPYTSATVKKISDILSQGGVEVSPAKIEHVLNGETGGFWNDMIKTAERAAGQAPPKDVMEPADMPIVGRLFIRDNWSNQIDAFYEQYEHLEAKKQTWKKLLKQGNERASKYELNDHEAAQLAAMERLSKSLAKLRQQYRESTTREERNAIWKDMTDFAKIGLEIE